MERSQITMLMACCCPSWKKGKKKKGGREPPLRGLLLIGITYKHSHFLQIINKLLERYK